MARDKRKALVNKLKKMAAKVGPESVGMVQSLFPASEELTIEEARRLYPYPPPPSGMPPPPKFDATEERESEHDG